MRHLGLTNHAIDVVLINQSKCKISDNLETGPNYLDISPIGSRLTTIASVVHAKDVKMNVSHNEIRCPTTFKLKQMFASSWWRKIEKEWDKIISTN